MTYYPIKCPYCLENHTNDTVRFRLRDAVRISSRTVKTPVSNNVTEQSEDVFSQTFGEDRENRSWDTPESDQASIATSQVGDRGIGAGRIDEDRYYTFAELKAFEGIDNVIRVKGEYKEVNACQALTMDDSGNTYDGELLNAVIITRIEGDREVTRAMYDRYCDCEDGRKLTMSSGSVPSYVVLLMGSSSAGKTVWLCSLYHELSRQSGYLLPPTDDPDKSLASITLTVLGSAGTVEAADADLVKMTEDLFEEGILPPTTISMFNEPLILDITIRLNHCDTAKKALLFMRDMPGETLTNPAMRQEVLRIANQFPKFDGFLIMFSPTTFGEGIFSAANPTRSREQQGQINRLRDVIVGTITPRMPNNMISQPTAAIITKGDLFFEKKNIGSLMNKGLNYAEPLLSAYHIQSYDEPYFNEIHAGAKSILNTMSRNIHDLMNGHFSDTHYSLVAALGKTTEALDINEAESTISAPNAIKPWLVTDAALKLLMRLQIVPPFDRMRMRRDDNEPEDERRARQFQNRAILNDWGTRYYPGWRQKQ